PGPPRALPYSVGLNRRALVDGSDPLTPNNERRAAGGRSILAPRPIFAIGETRSPRASIRQP
ncbi:hypothetical protein, partial [Bradyrhizobium sp.]|uniref:hypothetical protein n=1 Tax=Bradyrhizobium sp. TaxID=376 RepID=UPI00391A7FE5